jgi:DNA-binding transcriptional ArsR family regulator
MDGCPEPVEHVITVDDVDSLAVLTSNQTRMGIVDLLRSSERPLTIREIGNLINEDPSRLYYHMDTLRKHGFIMKCESVEQNGRTTATYMVRAKHFTLAPDVLHSETGQKFLQTGHFLLELVSRDLVRAVQSSAVKPSEDDTAPYHISRHIFRLDADKLAALKKKLKAAHDFAEDESDISGEGELFVLTHFLLRHIPPVTQSAGVLRKRNG